MTDWTSGGGKTGESAYKAYVRIEELAGRTPLSEADWTSVSGNPALVTAIDSAESAQSAAEAAQASAEQTAADTQDALYGVLDVTRIFYSWAELLLRTGTENFEGVEVLAADTGTHEQGTNTGYDGGTVPNQGIYRWVEAWGRWQRLGDGRSQLSNDLEDLQDQVDGLPPGTMFFRSGVTGDGAAYAVTADRVPAVGTQFVFVPNVASTVNTPTLTITVDGVGTTFNLTIRHSDTDAVIPLEASAAQFYVFTVISTTFATLTGQSAEKVAEIVDARTADIRDEIDLMSPGVMLFRSGVTGDGVAYSVTASKVPPVGSQFVFVPNVDSTANTPTLDIVVDGVSHVYNLTIRYDDVLAPVPLVAGTTRFYVFTVISTTFAELTGQNQRAQADNAVAALQPLQDQVDGLQQGAVLMRSGVTGDGSAYAFTGTVPLGAGDQFVFVPNVDSTVNSPVLTYTVDGVPQAITLYLRHSNGENALPLVASSLGFYVFTMVSTSFAELTGESRTKRAELINHLIGQTEAAVAESNPDPRLVHRHVASLPVPRFSDQVSSPYLIGAETYQYAPCIQPASLRVGASSTIDLSHFLDGVTATIHLLAGGKLIAGAGREFVGHAGGEMITADVDQAWEIRRVDDYMIATQLTPGTPTFGSADAITHDFRLIMGGQSNAWGMEPRGGWGGFAASLYRGLDGSGAYSVDFVNGATPGTAIDMRSNATAYWWDYGNSLPGPALDTFMAAVAAAVADGQSIPMFCFWTQGENDVGGLQSGAITTADMTATILAVWDYIWATYPSMIFWANPVGGSDNEARQKGTNAARAAYLDAVAARANAIQGVEYYDLTREIWDLHYDASAYARAGGRAARLYLNTQQAAANSLGPVVTAATLQADTSKVLLTIDWGSADAIEPFYKTLYHQRPWGLYALASGGDPVDDPIDFVSGVFQNDGNVMLTAGRDLTGCQVGGPYGACREAMLGHVLSDDSAENYVGEIGLPLRSFLMDIS